MQNLAETLQLPAYAFRLGTPHVKITNRYHRPAKTPAARVIDDEIRRGRVRNNERIQEVRALLEAVPARSLVWVQPLDQAPLQETPDVKSLYPHTWVLAHANGAFLVLYLPADLEQKLPTGDIYP